jgi:hypothetical protein
MILRDNNTNCYYRVNHRMAYVNTNNRVPQSKFVTQFETYLHEKQQCNNDFSSRQRTQRDESRLDRDERYAQLGNISARRKNVNSS